MGHKLPLARRILFLYGRLPCANSTASLQKICPKGHKSLASEGNIRAQMVYSSSSSRERSAIPSAAGFVWATPIVKSGKKLCLASRLPCKGMNRSGKMKRISRQDGRPQRTETAVPQSISREICGSTPTVTRKPRISAENWISRYWPSDAYSETLYCATKTIA